MKRKITAIWRPLGNNLKSESLEVQYCSKRIFAADAFIDIEEFMAAAHADCYMMNLIFELNQENFVAESLQTTSHITMVDGILIASHLTVTGKVPGIDFEMFKFIAKESVKTCLVSKSMNLVVTSEIILIHR